MLRIEPGSGIHIPRTRAARDAAGLAGGYPRALVPGAEAIGGFAGFAGRADSALYASSALASASSRASSVSASVPATSARAASLLLIGFAGWVAVWTAFRALMET